MNEELKTFLEENKELIRENRWCELYDKADGKLLVCMLANFLYKGLGQEVMLECFAEEGKMPSGAFYFCDSLESITIPDNVTTIGDSAFAACSSLTSITIPSSVTSIGEYAFRHCTSLPEITIPKSVTSIGEYAFYGCTCHIIIECDVKGFAKGALYNFEGSYEFK